MEAPTLEPASIPSHLPETPPDRPPPRIQGDLPAISSFTIFRPVFADEYDNLRLGTCLILGMPIVTPSGTLVSRSCGSNTAFACRFESSSSKRPSRDESRRAHGIDVETAEASDQLLGLGLAERIHARHAERLSVLPKDPTPDAETGTPECQGNCGVVAQARRRGGSGATAGELAGGMISE